MTRSIFTLLRRIPQSVHYYSVQSKKTIIMKNYRSLFTHSGTYLVIAAVLLTFVSCRQSETQVEAKAEPAELPFTSSSPEAMASFTKGMEFLDVGNSQQARLHFSKAIELDSNFASAYLYRSATSPSNEHFKSDLRS